MDAFRNAPAPHVLVNVEMLTEGYDAPRTKTVFLARPTKSEALLSQMAGAPCAVHVPGAQRRLFL
jgi:ATP-dependent helicase IRC3